MPNKIRKDPAKPESSEKETRRSHLRLVTRHSHVARSKKQHTYVVWAFLVLLFLTLGTIFTLRPPDSSSTARLYSSFISLRPTLTQEGIFKFQNDKGALRKIVNKALKEGASEAEQNTAQNIAVYLFPELLPDSDFEKGVATEDWKPLEEAIEKNPKSPESRLWFEEMRANIWNYESPDRETPRVSDYAKEVLRLYDELSAP